MKNPAIALLALLVFVSQPAFLLAQEEDTVAELLARMEARLAAQEAELAAMRSQMSAQQAEISRLQAELTATSEVVSETISREITTVVDARVGSTMDAKVATALDERMAASGWKPQGEKKVSWHSQFDINFYGYVKLDAAYDSHRTSHGNFQFWTLPEGSEANDDEFSLTANQTRFGMDITGPEIRGGQTMVKLEADFYGAGAPANSATPRMRKAYLDWDFGDWSLRFGQDTDTFQTLVPVSVDFAYFMDRGNLGLRRPQARVTRVLRLSEKTTLTGKLSFARDIGGDLDRGGQEDGADVGFPDVQWNLILKTPLIAGNEATFSLSGHYGREELDPAPGIRSGEYDSWSLIGSFIIPLHKTLKLQGSVFTGANLDIYFGGIGQGINTVLGTEIHSTGGWAQLVWNPNETWNFNLAYGVDDPDNDDLNIAARSLNEHYVGSVFYNFSKHLCFGLEYAYLETSYKGMPTADNHRTQGTVIFKF